MPGDQISITLYEKLPVSQEARSELKRVDENGEIFLLPIGSFKLGGLNLVKAEKLIEEKFSELVVSPHCEIQIVKKLYEPRVYVYGEVEKSGTVNYKPGDRLLDALSSAGGCSQDAYKRSIKVIRADKETINIYSIDLYDILNSGNIYKNIQLNDNDIIFIPRRFLTTWKEIFAALNPVIPWYVIGRGFFD
jgi:polysaccharide export outer membrane protein